MPIVTFDQWVEALVAHPLRSPNWYWDNDFNEYWDAVFVGTAGTSDMVLNRRIISRTLSICLLDSDVLLQQRVSCGHG